MMSTAPLLHLTSEQASRLQAYLQTYRRSALASLRPSAERNTTLRMLQGIQGKLLPLIDQQRRDQMHLFLTGEEMTTLKAIVKELLALYAKQSAHPERLAILADLADLKGHLRSY